MTLAPTPKEVDEKLSALLPGKNHQTVYNQLQEPEKREIFWAVETGQVNGELPEIFTEGILKVRERIPEWKEKNTALRTSALDKQSTEIQQKQKQEATLNGAVMKRQQNNFIKMLAVKILKIALPAGLKIDQVFEKIVEHHLVLSEKYLNPLLGAQGISDAGVQARIRINSWKMLYEKKFFAMPQFSICDGSTIETSIALLASTRYQAEIFGNTSSSKDDVIKAHLVETLKKIEQENAQEEETNEGLTIEESVMMFNQFLPLALSKIFETIESRIYAI